MSVSAAVAGSAPMVRLILGLGYCCGNDGYDFHDFLAQRARKS